MAVDEPKKQSKMHIDIDKSNARLMLIVGICAFITVFSMVAIKSLMEQRAYQSKVSSKKETALKQLQDNIAAVTQLEASYQEFASAPENLLGGNPSGNGDKDGNNPRLVLDALPGTYDFPALTTSVENLLSQSNFKLSGISGSDDEIAQSSSEAVSSPVEIPVTAEAKISPSSAKFFMEHFERSIRPFQVKKLSITGEDNLIVLTVDAITYYQPSKDLSVKEEVVR